MRFVRRGFVDCGVGTRAARARGFSLLHRERLLDEMLPTVKLVKRESKIEHLGSSERSVV